MSFGIVSAKIPDPIQKQASLTRSVHMTVARRNGRPAVDGQLLDLF